MTVIERILHVAESKNITQADIARALNKGTGQISQWKSRNTIPKTQEIYAISQLLNVSIEFLLTGEESPPTEPQLPEDEIILLEKYNACNAIGKDRIHEYAGLMSREHPIN